MVTFCEDLDMAKLLISDISYYLKVKIQEQHSNKARYIRHS